jgi:hypothetical protein
MPKSIAELRSTRSPAWPFAGALALSAALAGCGAATDADPDGPVSSEQLAAGAIDVDTWTPYQMPLAICYHRLVTNSAELDYMPDAEFDAAKNFVHGIIVSTWGTVPGMSFTRSCPATERMDVYLRRGGGGACPFRQPCEIGKDDGWSVVHETGHGLGWFDHEQVRPDAELCPDLVTYLEALYRCNDADLAGDPCSAADYNLLFAWLPHVTAPHRLNDEERALMPSFFAGNAPNPNLTLLTPPDPISVMNYCGSYFGRAAGDFYPTAYDYLSMEMMYPLPSGYPLKCYPDRGCFNTGDGVILAANGYWTSDWTSRGALNIPMSRNEFPAATYLTAGTLLSGSQTVNYNFWDPRGVKHTGSGTALVSTSVYTSILVGAGFI